MKKSLLLPVFILLSALYSSAAETNIFIPGKNETVTVLTEGSGSAMKVSGYKLSERISFTARSRSDKALAYTFYDKDTRINKAKAKGTKPSYHSASDEGIFFSDSRVCSLVIPVEPGKTVDAEFETTVTRPQFVPSFFLADLYPVMEYSLTVRYPAALPDSISIIPCNLPSAQVSYGISKDGKEKIITVSASAIPAMKNEPLSPSPRSYMPVVLLSGIIKDVSELYSFWHSYTSACDPRSAEVETFARELTKNCDSESERIAVIRDWVRANIRYVAIEDGDLGLIPDLPSQVLEKRFGDCKGSAALIKAMLKAVGTDGRFVWVGTDRIPYDFTDVPHSSTANHMIAAAVLPDTTIYIDGTVGLADPGFYSPSIQGKQTIIENGDSPLIGRVPVMPASASCNSGSMVLTLENNILKGIRTQSYTGVKKNMLLAILNSLDSKEREKAVYEFIKSDIKKASVSNVEVSPIAPDTVPLVISCGIEIPNATTRAGNKVYLNPELLPDFASMKCDTTGRVAPLRHSAPRTVINRVEISVPAELEIAELPADFTLDSDYLSASVSFNRIPTGVVAACRIVFPKREIPRDKISEYNAAVTKTARALSTNLILREL